MQRCDRQAEAKLLGPRNGLAVRIRCDHGANFGEAVEVFDADDEKRLLTIYDQLVNASLVPRK